MSNPSHRNDFQTTALLKEKTDEHDKTIKSLETRVDSLEQRTGDDIAFARSFNHALENEKTMDDAIFKIIDKHDSHNFKASAKAVVSKVIWLIIGAAITIVVTTLTKQ